MAAVFSREAAGLNLAQRFICVSPRAESLAVMSPPHPGPDPHDEHERYISLPSPFCLGVLSRGAQQKNDPVSPGDVPVKGTPPFPAGPGRSAAILRRQWTGVSLCGLTSVGEPIWVPDSEQRHRQPKRASTLGSLAVFSHTRLVRCGARSEDRLCFARVWILAMRSSDALFDHGIPLFRLAL